MIKEINYPFCVNIETGAPNEEAFVTSVRALLQALQLEGQRRLESLKKIYNITQEVHLHPSKVSYGREHHNTKGQNEYKDANPF